MKPLSKVNENLNQLNFKFLTNNVKGLQSTRKRLKLLNFLKNKIGPNGILLLKETHSSVEIEKKWAGNFKGNAQFVQKVTFEPLIDSKQNHCGSWKYYKSCYL